MRQALACSYEYTRATNARELRDTASNTQESAMRGLVARRFGTASLSMCGCMALNRHSHRTRPAGGRESCYGAAAIFVSSC